jgi:hypothetical protein
MQTPKEIEAYLRDFTGIWPGDEGLFEYTTIPVDQLVTYGTATGKKDMKCFKRATITWLKSHGVETAHVLIGKGEEDHTIACMMIQLDINKNQVELEKFSNMIHRNGGSLRPDNGPKGWTIFEVE